jgi:hypothetical protein
MVTCRLERVKLNPLQEQNFTMRPFEVCVECDGSATILSLPLHAEIIGLRLTFAKRFSALWRSPKRVPWIFTKITAFEYKPWRR